MAAMEVLIRWLCPACSQLHKARCYDCKGNGYLEGWVPSSLLNDVGVLKGAFLIRGRRKNLFNCPPLRQGSRSKLRKASHKALLEAVINWFTPYRHWHI